jgi:hypothetical protein
MPTLLHGLYCLWLLLPIPLCHGILTTLRFCPLHCPHSLRCLFCHYWWSHTFVHQQWHLRSLVLTDDDFAQCATKQLLFTAPRLMAIVLVIFSFRLKSWCQLWNPLPGLDLTMSHTMSIVKYCNISVNASTSLFNNGASWNLVWGIWWLESLSTGPSKFLHGPKRSRE